MPGEFTATVDWGDGTTETSGDGNLTIIQSDGPGSTFIVKGSHTYADSTAGQPPYILSITVADAAGGNSVFQQGTATISDPTLHATFNAFTAIVGVAYTGPIATFTDDAPDPDLGDYTAMINWGDGTPETPGTITLANQAGQTYIVTYTGSHTFSSTTTGQDPDVVTVSITKNETDTLGTTLTESATVLGNVAVADPGLHPTFTTFTPVAGAIYSGPVASFTEDDPIAGLENNPDPDPGKYYTATIDWGDALPGSPPDTSPGTIVETSSNGSSFIVEATHTYAFPTTGISPNVVSVTITRDNSSEGAFVIGNVAVADSLLYPASEGALPPAVEGVAYLAAGGVLPVVAQFVDANPNVTAANFNGPADSATVITWGDGKSSAGTVVGLGNGVFDVVGTHIYGSPTLFGVPNTVSVAVTDQWGGKTTITNTIVVLPAPITFASLALPTNLATPLREGAAYTGDVILFTSPNLAALAGEYTATINWGDGSLATTGTVSKDGTGVFHVSGTHSYLEEGVYPITVTILVTGGVTFTGLSSATVLDAPITFTPTAPPPLTAGGAVGPNRNILVRADHGRSCIYLFIRQHDRHRPELDGWRLHRHD